MCSQNGWLYLLVVGVADITSGVLFLFSMSEFLVPPRQQIILAKFSALGTTQTPLALIRTLPWQ